jgi:hypothetical protein
MSELVQELSIKDQAFTALEAQLSEQRAAAAEAISRAAHLEQQHPPPNHMELLELQPRGSASTAGDMDINLSDSEPTTLSPAGLAALLKRTQEENGLLREEQQIFGNKLEEWRTRALLVEAERDQILQHWSQLKVFYLGRDRTSLMAVCL